MRFYSFEEMLCHFASATPDAPALYYGQKERRYVCSFSELKLMVDRRAAELSASGGTCVGILSDSSLSCVVTVFAAVQAGLQVVMLDENLPVSSLEQAIRYTDADLLRGDPDLCEELEPFLTGGIGTGSGKILFFTSGTTDSSKAVVLSDRTLMASAWNGGELLPLTPDDVLLCMLPLNHVFGFVCGLLWGLSCGAAVALGRGPRHYHEDCCFFRPTALSAVPLLLGFLLRQNVLNPELKLILVGAGDCPSSLLESAKKHGIRISFGYGLTETSSGVALSLGSDPYAMTVCPEDTIEIAEDGEILISAPTCIMEGYYNRPAETDLVLQGGVLHTGDLGHLDHENCLHITGRKKEIIVLGDGTKLYLPEYERECAEALKTQELCILLSDGKPALLLGSAGPEDPSSVLKRLSGVLEKRPRGQQIRKILFYSGALPRTATGKIKRWILQLEVERNHDHPFGNTGKDTRSHL